MELITYLWEFPATDFDRWQVLEQAERLVHDYADYATILDRAQ